MRVALALRSSVESSGEVRYCYVDENGNQSPTLRLAPGDLLVLRLKNELPNLDRSSSMNPGGFDLSLRESREVVNIKLDSPTLEYNSETCNEND